MFIKFSKFFLFVNVKIFAVTYLILTFVFSIIFALIKLPPSYFSDSKNALNVYFMKYPFEYVVALLLIFIFCAHFPLCLGRWCAIMPPIFRVLFAYLLYQLMRAMFRILHELLGTCEGHPQFDNRKLECIYNDHTWMQFAISGHAFYVLYGMLIILEETRIFSKWEQVEELIDREELVNYDVPGVIGIANMDEVQNLVRLFRKFSPFVKVSFVANAILMILLHADIIITIVYYHKVLQKMEGVLLAALLWILTYGLVFKLTETEIERQNTARNKPKGYNSMDKTISNYPGQIFGLYPDKQSVVEHRRSC